MGGLLRQRGTNSWQLIVFNGFDSQGRRQYSRKGIHGTKKQAETALAAYVIEVGGRRADVVAEGRTGIIAARTGPVLQRDHRRVRSVGPAHAGR